MNKLVALFALLPSLVFAAPVVDLVTNRGTIEITLDQAHGFFLYLVTRESLPTHIAYSLM